MTYRELLKQLESVEDHRLDEEIEVEVCGEYFSEVIPVHELAVSVDVPPDSDKPGALQLVGSA